MLTLGWNSRQQQPRLKAVYEKEQANMEFDASRTVKEIVLEIPASVGVFERLGIDYCCGGDKNLEDACQAAGRPVREVLRSLEAAINSAQAETGATDWSQEPLANLMKIGRASCRERG